jgi:hypothetical protein
VDPLHGAQFAGRRLKRIRAKTLLHGWPADYLLCCCCRHAKLRTIGGLAHWADSPSRFYRLKGAA